MARMVKYDKDRLSYKISLYKNWDFISAIAKRHDLQEGRQLHCRRLHVWRWERALYKYWGRQDWKVKALDCRYWKSKLGDMVEWKSKHA